ncbi:MAG: alkaline phosphatase D family protein [Pseudomonadota bacterium]
MSQITRRGAFGLAGGLAGLAACGAEDAAAPEIATPPYAGEVGFDHGVASGDPLHDRVILWTRVTPRSGEGAIPVAWAVYTDESLTELAASGAAETTAARDFTIKVDALGLEAGRDYYYRFLAKTAAGDVASPTGRTKTAALAGDAPVKLAVVSCSNYPFGYFNAYKALSETPDLDAVVHLGDYLYEYGIDGYGGEAGEALGRRHDPITEIVTLDDYRTRHAQYKSDPDLQAAHASAPWICTWDDHESTNNSYRSGAENHNVENNEGDWSDRKQVAVQAYLEWMPVRDPQRGRAREAIYRKFDFGEVATIFCLESRLTGRSDEISWFAELGGKEPAEVPGAALAAMQRVNDPSRTMLGDVQEDWLARGLEASVEGGKSWQVLANQVIMAKVRAPNFTRTLTEEQKAAQTIGYIQQLIPFSQLGLAWNLDAWDGFPAARDRLYEASMEAGARLVTLTGDTHTAWANTLHSGDDVVGVEFACTSVTSPGFGAYMFDVPDLGEQFAEANEDVDWYNPVSGGFLIVTLTKDAARGAYYDISTVTEREFEITELVQYESRIEDDAQTPLQRL